MRREAAYVKGAIQYGKVKITLLSRDAMTKHEDSLFIRELRPITMGHLNIIKRAARIFRQALCLRFEEFR